MVVISKDGMAINIAKVFALRSKDPKTQVGACILDRDYRLVSGGYNGLSHGMEDSDHIWSKEVKHDFVVHAEVNAILNSRTPVKGCVLFATKFPCKECCKSIIQAGIVEVVFSDNHVKDCGNQLLMFENANVKIRQIENL